MQWVVNYLRLIFIIRNNFEVHKSCFRFLQEMKKLHPENKVGNNQTEKDKTRDNQQKPTILAQNRLCLVKNRKSQNLQEGCNQSQDSTDEELLHRQKTGGDLEKMVIRVLCYAPKIYPSHRLETAKLVFAVSSLFFCNEKISFLTEIRHVATEGYP